MHRRLHQLMAPLAAIVVFLVPDAFGWGTSSGGAHAGGAHAGMAHAGMPPAPPTVSAEDARVALKGIRAVLEIPASSPLLKGVEVPKQDGGSGLSHLFGRGTVKATVEVTDDKYGDLPVAAVGGLAVTVRDIADGLVEAGVAGVKLEPETVVERLIGSRLIVLEGREIGLDQLPEVGNLVQVKYRRLLRQYVMTACRESVELAPEEIERLYQELITEYRIRALVFKEEAAAKGFADTIAAGGDFDIAAAKEVAAGSAEAKGGDEGEYVPRAGLVREVAEALSKMAVGALSAPIATKEGFLVMRLEEVRRTDDPAARTLAVERAGNIARNRALVALNQELTERYVTIDQDIFGNLDFSAGLDVLLKDERPLAVIKGSQPVSVAAFAQEVKERYFHGLGRAIESGRLAEDKHRILREMLFKEVFVTEALARGIDKTPAFRREMDNYERSAIFGAFVQRVLVPESRITMAELETYYKSHIGEYAQRSMVGIRSLAFSTAEDARDALGQLSKGADFRWLKSNAPNQIPEGNEDVLHFHDKLLMTDSLSEDVQKAIQGAEEGSVRAYADEEGHHYVLLLDRVIPAQMPTLQEVQEDIMKKAFDEKVQTGLADWTAKLRQAYRVDVYVKEFLKRGI